MTTAVKAKTATLTPTPTPSPAQSTGMKPTTGSGSPVTASALRKRNAELTGISPEKTRNATPGQTAHVVEPLCENGDRVVDAVTPDQHTR